MQSLEEIMENVDYLYTDYPDLLNQIFSQTYNLMMLMKQLRDLYKKRGNLPMFPINSEMENMMYVVDLIETEALKFGEPRTVRKEFSSFSEEELREWKEDEEDWGNCIFAEWEEEGLLNLK